MTNGSYLRAGAALAWQRKRYLAWMYAGSLLLAGAGALEAARRTGPLLNHSLAADRLVHGFDVGTLFAVFGNPAYGPSTLPALAGTLAALYFVFILFLTPGIVFSFVHDERPSTASLFRESGEYFWSFVRLLLWTALIGVPVLGGLNAGRGALLKAMSARNGDERVQFAVSLGSFAVIVVVAWLLRLWFDLAEFHLVRRGDKAARKTLAPAWRALWSAPWRLFGIHGTCAIAGAAVFALGAWAWWHAPSQAVWLAFLIGQGMTVAMLAARYWQRASEAAWFRANLEPTPSAVVIPFTTGEAAPSLSDTAAPAEAE